MACSAGPCVARCTESCKGVAAEWGRQNIRVLCFVLVIEAKFLALILLNRRLTQNINLTTLHAAAFVRDLDMRIEALLKGKVSEAEAKNLGLRDTEVRLTYYGRRFFFVCRLGFVFDLPMVLIKIVYREIQWVVTLGLMQAEMDAEVSCNVNRIDAEKFQCAVCMKLFKGAEFVKKHIVNKHADFAAGIRNRVCTLAESFCHRC